MQRGHFSNYCRVRNPVRAYPLIPIFLLALALAAVSSRAGMTISQTVEADTNHFDACAEAARHYEIHDLPDKQIIALFKAATDTGDARATMWAARLYFKGRCGLPEMPDLAQKEAKGVLNQVMVMATNGNVEAEFLLGSAYQEGLGVDKNFEKAVPWYTKAVEAGHITAMNNFAAMLAMGQGIDQDLPRARRLFARAEQLGSQTAEDNAKKFVDHGNADDFNTLRTLPLVQALGMQTNDAIAFLTTNGLITDPKDLAMWKYKGQDQFHFKTDGIIMNANNDGRVVDVEAHAKGSWDMQQYRGDLPFGLSWNNTASTTEELLGPPDDCGDVSTDSAYGMAYQMKNISFATMFFYEGERKLKIWRVFELYPDKYAPAQAPAPKAHHPHMAAVGSGRNG